jgi:uncharacterized damage-inducible protein DinB
MHTPTQIAKHFREVHFGGNWTAVNLNDTLADVSWKEAVTPVHKFNTIATLANHINYYVSAILPVLEGQPLNAKDELSFTHPPIECEEDWDDFLLQCRAAVEKLTTRIEALPEDLLGTPFTDEKYGLYYRNLHGLIEHSHYHLGQIVLIKKLLRQ